MRGSYTENKHLLVLPLFITLKVRKHQVGGKILRGVAFNGTSDGILGQ